MGVGGVAFTKATIQVVVGRPQWEEAVAGVHHPLDEGPDFGQGLVVRPSSEPAFAKVVTKEAQPVLGQFAGEFALKGADAALEGVYFGSSWWSTLQKVICQSGVWIPAPPLDSRLRGNDGWGQE